MTPDDLSADGPVHPGSVSRLIPPLSCGDREAAGALWRYFYRALVEVAARRLVDAFHAAIGPDDVAQEAILELCQEMEEKRFPRLHSRQDLWRLLVCITVRRACDVRSKFGRRVQNVAGESALGEAGIESVPCRRLPDGFSMAVEELLALLPDDTHRTVALMRMEGHSNEQIAQRIDRAVTTVEVKLKTIRAVLRPRLDDFD